MKLSIPLRRALIPALAASAVAGAAAIPAADAASSPFTVVASNLDNPRHLNFGPDGALYVAEAGRGGNGACATDETGAKSCIGLSGSILRVKGKSQRRVVKNLPSVAPANGQQASGPADAIVAGRRLAFVVQDTNLDSKGGNPFGALGRLLGKLAIAPFGKGKPSTVADLARFEARNNPDHGAGAQQGGAIDSDPYALLSYKGGYLVADAAGNDLLRVDRKGKISLVAVFPTQNESVPAGVVGPAPATIPVQSVPTSVAIGPDGAIYVGELTGFPFKVGAARVWRVKPGHKPTVYASGFTNITDIAFDRKGRLLVLELDKAGLEDQGKTSGELIRLDRSKRQTVLAGDGLTAATGLAVARNGGIYVSIFGIFPGSGQGPHGEVVRLNTR